MNPQLSNLQKTIDKLLSQKANPIILEAGCGSTTHINLPEDSYIIGIDISPEQLQNNDTIHKKIVGDIQTYNLPANNFDAIICWNVLEHIDQPEKALRNFINGLKVEGILILALPNVHSLKGLVTRCTPFAFHKWFRKNVLGYKKEPFPTFFRFAIAPNAIKRFAIKNKLSVEYFQIYNALHIKDFNGKYKILAIVLQRFSYVLKILTFGYYDPGLTDFVIVLKKQTSFPIIGIPGPS